MFIYYTNIKENEKVEAKKITQNSDLSLFIDIKDSKNLTKERLKNKNTLYSKIALKRGNHSLFVSGYLIFLLLVGVLFIVSKRWENLPKLLLLFIILFFVIVSLPGILGTTFWEVENTKTKQMKQPENFNTLTYSMGTYLRLLYPIIAMFLIIALIIGIIKLIVG